MGLTTPRMHRFDSPRRFWYPVTNSAFGSTPATSILRRCAFSKARRKRLLALLQSNRDLSLTPGKADTFGSLLAKLERVVDTAQWVDYRFSEMHGGGLYASWNPLCPFFLCIVINCVIYHSVLGTDLQLIALLIKLCVDYGVYIHIMTQRSC